MKKVFVNYRSLISANEKAENTSLLVTDEKISELCFEDRNFDSDEEIDLFGAALYAGFIDVHIHGAVGIDVNSAEADGLVEIAKFLAKNGVTAWVPTLVPDSDENYRRAIDAIDELMEIQGDQPIAQAIGVHYEGVFANEKMCGALRPEFFKKYAGDLFPSLEKEGWPPFADGVVRSSLTDEMPSAKETTTPSADHPADEASAPLLKPGGELRAAIPPLKGGEFLELPRLKRGIHMTTLAPEIEGGIGLIKELVRHGWVVSIGHSKADVETLDLALTAGAKHLTHFYNAMTGLHHRDIGVAGWGLTNDAVTFDIIADGIHVHPRMLEFACRSKTAEMVTLISDSVAAAGLGDGEYDIWGEKVSVVNGKTRNERGSIAGSVITMLDAVKLMLSLGFAEAEVSKMASLNPAKLLGIHKTHGSIEVGKRADLVAIDAHGNIKLVMIGGRIVFEA